MQLISNKLMVVFYCFFCFVCLFVCFFCMQIWGEIHITVAKTVKHDSHMKLRAAPARHHIPI